MVEFTLQVPSLKVIVAAVWRLFDRLSSGPNFQVLMADLIWWAYLLGLQGALLCGAFLQEILVRGFFKVSFLQGGLLGSLFLRFLGIRLGLDGSLPSRDLLLVNSLLSESCFFGLLFFDRRFLARVLLLGLGFG